MTGLNEIVVDPEFRDLMPSRENDSLLREKIESEGWNEEPLTVWKDKNILLDGHRRYAIWKDRDDQGPAIRELKFDNREEAYRWVVNNQLARRNLTDAEQRIILGLKYKAEKNLHGGTRSGAGRSQESTPKNLGLILSDDESHHGSSASIGKEHGVSHTTVENAEKYADNVQSLDETGVVSLADIRSEKVKPTQKAVKEAATLAKEGKIEEAKKMIHTNPKPKTKEGRATSTTKAERKGPQWERAVSAEADAKNFLQRSKLVRLGKTNPHREYAFNEVIRWLKTHRKGD